MRPRRSSTARRIVRVAAAIAADGFVRERMLRWGATDDELALVLPGDELLLTPALTSTRAITIGAHRADVWPWIAQLGYGRGGFYTYDRLENLVGVDIHNADTIVPEWQDLGLGDDVLLAPTVPLQVARLDPQRAVVLRGAVPMGKIEAPYDFTWAFVLDDVPRASAGSPNGGTRLIVRERYAYRRAWAPLLVEPIEVISFVMTQRMLRGVRNRAERSPHRHVGAGGVTPAR